MGETTETSEATVPTKKPLGRVVKLLIGGGSAFVVLVILLIVAQFWPTQLDRVNAEHDAFAVTGQRKKGGGCGLNQIASANGCDRVESTFEEQEVSFVPTISHGPAELNGTLALPTGIDGKRPGAVLIHGSGPNARDGNTPGDLLMKHEALPVLKVIAHHLAAQGIATLRYDKRACANCYPNAPIDKDAFNFSDFASDARDAVAFLAQHDGVDPKRIVVIGHSQGGKMAAFVAHDNPSVAAVIFLAATTQSFEHGLVGQLERIEAIRLAQFDVFGTINWSVARRTYQACFDKMRDDYDASEECLGGGVTQRALKEYEEFGKDTVARIEALAVPWLAIQGTLDRNIDPEVIFGLRDLAKTRDAEAHYIEGIGHSLVNGLDQPEPATIDARVFSVMGAFLSSVKSGET